MTNIANLEGHFETSSSPELNPNHIIWNPLHAMLVSVHSKWKLNLHVYKLTLFEPSLFEPSRRIIIKVEHVLPQTWSKAHWYILYLHKRECECERH